ncbi:VOC family protein [Caballeronia sp. SEWSISQ10-4 2]|uniref:VOC family protein n=1 Tax=Caballeronia sp. SEWSISQ10-4 2 TaxID=2937438 RepID=UPI00264BD82A|nr:VOC family protein [Caballeronia sp. SEWSISQ10-4 2]MDN7176552.1 VOC family protein [Caballeronia sp. SEWSISQ10-4 2]
MRLEPYLFFNGRTEEALKFYQKAIGAETLSVLHFKDSPEGVNATPEWQDKIMHATFRIGPSVIMASDGVDAAPQVFSGFSISIAADDIESGQRMFDALSVGGDVRMAWQPTFWTSGFGMVSDRFGMPWMVTVMDELGT